MKEIFNSIKAFNEGMGVENAIKNFIPNLYSYVETRSNGENRYLFSGAKDDDPNAYITEDGKFLTMHHSDTIGCGRPMTAFDIVKKYICNNDSKETYKYLVNQGYIQTPTHQPNSLGGESWCGLNITNYADIDTNIEPISYLVDGLIPRNMISLIFGQGGSGKSTVIQNMVKSLIEKTDFCTRETHLGDDEKILFIQAATEESKEIVAKKLHNMGLSQNTKRVLLTDYTGTSIENFQKGLSSIVKTENIKLIIIDSATSLLNGKDDNANSVVDNILLNLSKIVHENKCSILLIHHSRKRNKEGFLSNSVDDLLGSQRWSAGVRLVHKISTDKKTRTTSLSVVKENIFFTSEENYDGTLEIIADENMNYSFNKFTPTSEINEKEKVSKNEEIYNKIVDYISSTTLETIKQKFIESPETGHWQFLLKEIGETPTGNFSTAAKKYFEKNLPDTASVIKELKK